MLETKKVVTLTAESKVEENAIVQLNATIDVNAGIPTTYTEFIIDQDKYREYKTQVRQDMEAFRNQMYEIEDSEIAEDALKQKGEDE